MDDILKYCIRVNGITAYYPIYDEVSSQTLESRPEMSMKYGWNNGKVSFVTEDGSYYVTPFCSEVAEALRKLGYTDGSLYVPFSNGDVPSDKDLAAKWETLCTEARKQFNERQERERRERYRKLAEEKYLSALPEEVYQMSLAIPEDGLETTWMGQERSKTRPIDEWRVPECMGTYCQNNGKVSFVDANGRMFVTPFCFEVSQMLRAAGYQERGLFVPLSNGEEIVDSTLAAKWETLCTEARKQFNERQERERRERYRKLAEEKHLSALPEEVYQLSLAIPEDGLETTWMGQERSKTRPIDEWRVPECMGTYCQNNGRVSFVDANGKMFVTPFCFEVRQMLSESGYQERGLFVPLSNGEEIVDPIISTRWEAMCEKAREMYNQRQQQNGSGLKRF